MSEVAATNRPSGKQVSRLRYWLVLSILAIATVLLCVALYTVLIEPDRKMSGALWGGSMAALATALGTLPILFSLNFSQRSYDSMLGFGAGVMLAACSFSLIIPALDAAESQGLGPWGGSGIVAGGLLIGALTLLLIDRVMPHEHFVKGLEGVQARKLKRVWLFVLAISLHNLPEGLAIGVGFTGPDILAAQALAMGIAIQDVPEGMVVALALRGVGYNRGLSAGVAVLSGLVEPLAAVVGVAIIGISASLLPWGLAAAAGAMLFVISHEIIPESHRQGHESAATIGLMLGFALMMALDTALG
ncbi:ZIP family metal transporter [Pollutimonas subterranea]